MRLTIMPILILIGSGCIILSGCGKKEKPTTPYNVPSDFPQTYPPLEDDEG